MPRVLIVAYGNPMRSDDGLAWRAADELTKTFASPEVEVLHLQQLAPEVAEVMSRAEAVIFVDASATGGEAGRRPGKLDWRRVRTKADTSRISHHLTPGAALALAKQLYQAQPNAFSVTLTGESFRHGETLSPAVRAALPVLIERVEALVKQCLSAKSNKA